MSKVFDRARFVCRVGRVNWFRCLLCGATHPASTIARHVKAHDRPHMEKPDGQPEIRFPYRDD